MQRVDTVCKLEVNAYKIKPFKGYGKYHGDKNNST